MPIAPDNVGTLFIGGPLDGQRLHVRAGARIVADLGNLATGEYHLAKLAQAHPKTGRVAYLEVYSMSPETVIEDLIKGYAPA